MCEVLAPAGDEQSFYAAVHSGADAVYLGLTDFSARRSAKNFSLENLKSYLDYAHILGVKVYVALNTLVKNEELGRFFSCAVGAWNAGADALIIQDIFLGAALKKKYREMTLHLSTQAGVCNEYGAKLAKRYGFERVILARETPLESIRKIASIIETEVFVQGAMCTCFSGQCRFSAVAGGNSGNRGLCKQPCRKKYKIDRYGYEELSYKLSLSDLCLGQDLQKLIAAGVSSFKIEGRMRSAAYVGAAVSYYKNLLSEKSCGSDFSELKRSYNRGNYTRGYLYGQDKTLIFDKIQGHTGEQIGEVASVCKDGKVFIRSKYVPCEGDGFKILRKGVEVGGTTWSANCKSEKGGFYLPRGKFQVGDTVCLTLDTAFADKVSKRRKKIKLLLDYTLKEGEKAEVRVHGPFGERVFFSEFVVENANSCAFSEKDIESCFCKTDTKPFEIVFGKHIVGENIFVVRSALNAFRRDVFDEIYKMLVPRREQISNTEEMPFSIPFEKGISRSEKQNKIVVIDDDFSKSCYKGQRFSIAVYAPHDYRNAESVKKFLADSQDLADKKYLYLPAYVTDEDLKAVNNLLDLFDGIYADGVFALEYCREKGKPLFGGLGMNVFNYADVAALKEEGVNDYAVSWELSARENEPFGQVYRFSGGSMKIMELGHCPFGRNCKTCDKRKSYSLTDEGGRVFPLFRYENSVCRFEVFNSALLVTEKTGQDLFDFRLLTDDQIIAYLTKSGKELKQSVGNYTSGLTQTGVR